MAYTTPDLKNLPKATLTEVGSVLEKGEYFYRTIALSDGTVGEAWYKSRAKAEYLDKVLGQEVPYKTVKNKRDGVNITLYVSDEDSFKKESSPKLTDRQKEWQVKEEYYARLEEYKQKREEKNDPKIEFQSYLSTLAPFYVAAVTGRLVSVDEGVEALYAKAKEIFARENPVA